MSYTGSSKADNAFCQVLSKYQAYTIKNQPINQTCLSSDFISGSR